MRSDGIELSEYEGKWITFEFENTGRLMVIPRCATCQRWLSTKLATAIVNGLGGLVKFEGFFCKQHGEVQPTYWEWE